VPSPIRNDSPVVPASVSVPSVTARVTSIALVPASTSVTLISFEPVKVRTESSLTARLLGIVLSGASLIERTVMSELAVAALKALVPPPVLALPVPPLLPVD